MHIRLWLHSRQFGQRREVIVRLPASYEATVNHYPVVFVQDGDEVLDDGLHTKGWQIDRAGEPGEVIVVGVLAGGDRVAEYSPFEDKRFGGGDGHRYLDFLVETLKPAIDRQFRTLPGRESTAILGASLGGMISIVALMRHPQVFGAGAAFSPSVSFAEGALGRQVAAAEPIAGRVYVDAGTREFGPNSDEYVHRVRAFANELAAKVRAEALLYREVSGGTHRPSSWGQRFSSAAEFMLGPQGLELEG